MRIAWSLLFALPVFVACSTDGGPRIHVDVTIEVVDEHNEPLEDAVVQLDGQTFRSDAAGHVTLPTSTGPVLAVVSGAGLLPEPVIIGRNDDHETIRVRMWSDKGGARWTMHSGGDVMFGRRYNQPSSGDPLIPVTAAGGGAQHVVAALRRAYVAASVRTLNLETVVSNLTSDAAYPGKRFILNSVPETLAGVQALEPTLVGLANNHARDYMDEGVRLTADALDQVGIPWFGASDGTFDADAPKTIDVAGQRVGMLAWTTVNGSFVNDNYPAATDPVPSDISESELWQYEARSWGFEGTIWSVPVLERRIGAAWRMFDEVEDSLPARDVADAWSSLVAVYPELQDWVARRGHGGAAGWETATSPDKIAALAAESDMVIVQLHAGFQFQPAPSSYVRSIARKSIDAGATIVICHHPHVLQGVEWYRGALIVYSLGNFVFDQDFFATFPTAFIRTVWDGTTLIEARFIPLELVGYRPMPSADTAARRTLLRVWEMSVMSAESRRVDEGVRVFGSVADADTQTAHIRIDRGTGLITKTPPAPVMLSIDLSPDTIAPIGFDGLVDPRLGLTANTAPGLLVGRDLLGWGRFEDALADNQDTHGAHWALSGTRKQTLVDTSAADGVGYLRLTRFASNSSSVLARPVARTVIPAHRLYADDEGTVTPVDPPATYSIVMRARVRGGGEPAVRIDLFDFDDTNPTEDPSSTAIGRVTLPLSVPADEAWHDVTVDLDPAILSDSGQRANMMMIYVRLGTPAEGETNFDVDGLQIIEWRRADAMPDRFGDFSHLRNTGETRVSVNITGMPASDP